MKIKLGILFMVISLLPACSVEEFRPLHERSVAFADYPSGSAVSYLNDKLYVMGDDAADILVLDADLSEMGRIAIFSAGDDLRLPKASKADIEASFVISHDQKPLILFLGSGSLSPYRDSTFLMDPASGKIKRLSSKAFFDELRKIAKEVNVEAAAVLGDAVLLGLRANNKFRDNYIVLAEFDGTRFRYQRRIALRTKQGMVGISGMDYDEKEDMLFITFSSEDTSSAYEDGEIGESYLAVVPNAKDALNQDTLALTSIIKLSQLSPDLLRQKIESLAIIKDHRKLLLVSDNDQGDTGLFLIRY